MGPKTFKGNRYDYNMMLQKSKSEEIVLNIVRARYWETPFFLQVGSISSSFGYSFNVGASASLTNNLRNSAPGLDTYTPSLGTKISEAPTVTYTPLQGEKAIRQLQTEMSLEHFLILTRIGFDINSLFWTAVAQVGDLHNYNANAPVNEATLANYSSFLELADILRKMQLRNDLEFTGLNSSSKDNKVLRMQLRCRDKEELATIADLLSVEPEKILLPDDSMVVTVEFTSVRDMTEQMQPHTKVPRIPIRLKSFFQILYDFSGFVQVPEEQEQKKVARPFSPLREDLASRKGLHSGLISIKSSSSPPRDTYLSIAYRDRYFYVRDNDMRSKAYLMLMESIFSLLSGDIESVKPLITIPVGGR
ncbi:MAG: hypothetical protein ACLFRC_10740 [Desulfonatronovibrionaceae bacterium]